MIYSRIGDTLNRALAVVGRCDEVYRRGGPQVRRLSNQFFFEKLLIAGDPEDGAHVRGAILNEPWGTLVSEGFGTAMVENTTKPRPRSFDRRFENECFGAPGSVQPQDMRMACLKT